MKPEGNNEVAEAGAYAGVQVPAGSLAVLGDPVAHSLSPVMHNAALAEMGRRDKRWAGWHYRAVHVRAEGIGEAVKVLHEAGFAGLNLTLPHKVGVWPYLEEVDETTRAMGAANTLVRTEGGWRGTNTDGYGIRRALGEALGMETTGRDIWLFGAGGAARGIAVACLEGKCGRLTVVNRGAERLEALGRQLAGVAGRERVRLLRAEAAPLDAEAGALYINATSLGLRAEDPCPVAVERLAQAAAVYDTTYGCRNQLAVAAERLGVRYADGLSMLVWQGVRSLSIWTGSEVPAAVMRGAAEAELARRAGR